MRNGSTRSRRCAAGFTFAEVLAALAIMAIVLPVAIEGMRLANRAGVVAQRKGVAVQLADGLLNEMIAMDSWQGTDQSGTFGQDREGYRWKLFNENWGSEAVRLVTVEVIYLVQNQEYSVRLSTLAPPPATAN